MATHRLHKSESYILVLILALIAAGVYMAFLQEQQNRRMLQEANNLSVGQEKSQSIQTTIPPTGGFLVVSGTVEEITQDHITIIVSDLNRAQGAPERVTGLIDANTRVVRIREIDSSFQSEDVTIESVIIGSRVALTRNTEEENQRADIFGVSQIALIESA